jgi:indole-3-glycerol phosphate synthase/phosphoribosylanthranilate isomerase
MNIRDEIVEKRKARIGIYGHTMGAVVPAARPFPIVPFGRSPFLIAEVKRRSPSRGSIAPGINPVAQASLYRDQGISSISVLTEEEYFTGSLNDLVAIKRSFPDLAVLRKDFLIDESDIDVSFRAGADAVLLIASVLSKEKLSALSQRAAEYGMAVLMEVHSEEDAAKVRALKPPLTGINSRDLETFSLDPVAPLKLRRHIDWPTKLVYESGILSKEDAAFALSSGFDGILVGEAVMRNPLLAGELTEAFSLKANDFWGRLYRKFGSRPLVKICGITNADDARCAVDCGADILGFVFADSPRKTDVKTVRALANLDVLKVGITVALKDARPENGIRTLLDEGLIQAVQFHGEEDPAGCFSGAFPYYKAVRLKESADVGNIGLYKSPRVLVDAFSREVMGGTGKLIDPGLVEAARRIKPLWIAGGIGLDNVGDIISRFSPELIDASSRLEASPGKKDHELLKRFFREINKTV